MTHDHDVRSVERHGPLSDYVQCKRCGRAANTIEELAERPCKPGIGVGE